MILKCKNSKSVLTIAEHCLTLVRHVSILSGQTCRREKSIGMNQRRFTRSEVFKYSTMKKAMQISFTRRAARFTYDIYTRLLTRANIFLHARITKNPIRRPSAKQNHRATRFSWIYFLGETMQLCKRIIPSMTFESSIDL